MSTEMIAVIIMLVVNIIGWALTIRRNDKSSSKREGKLETTVNNLKAQMELLPCKEDSKYIADIGGIKADIRSINGRLSRIEDKIFDGGG